MSFLRNLFDGRLRRARALSAKGDWRGAAALYAELGMREDAAKCLAHLGTRAGSLDAALGAWLDALEMLPDEAEEARKEIEIQMGRRVREDAKARGAATAEEKRRLADAAERLERNGRYAEAADCWEMLGRTEDLARCLELGGEVERLEKVLAKSNAKERGEDRLRRLMSEHDMAMEFGARGEARRALSEASALAPEDRHLSDTLRRLEARWPAGGRVRLDVGGKRVTFVGRLPLVLGRAEADVVLRGGSVSRRHAEIARTGDTLVVRDLGSRNGTLLAGVPIGADVALSGAMEVGLGDDVAVRLEPSGQGVWLEVLRGLDRGDRVAAGSGALRIEGLPASVRFEGDRAVLEPDAGHVVTLGARSVARVDLLRGDVVSIGSVRIEVIE